MVEYKVWVNYILVRLGLRKILPSKIISNVKIKECNEELVRIDEDLDIIFDERMKKPVYLRKTVYEKLKIFVEEMKKYNLKIKLYDAYRSLDDQLNSWNKRLEETKKEFKDLSEEQIEMKTKLKVANPKDLENVGGHQTGGAIDITLVDENGNELDMGTKYEEYNEKTLTHSKNITIIQRKNREMLLNGVKKLEFVNFPAEWWHFCYGDKMWAAYKYKKFCFYGYIDNKK